MLASPGWRERDRQAIVLSLFVVGLFLGGAVTASGVWMLSGVAAPLPFGWRATVIIAIAILAVLRDANVVKLPLPENARQVPQSVLQRGLTRGGLQFGFELGTGVRTFISSSSPYVVAAALLLSHERWQAAIAAGLGFGGGRAATTLVRFWSRKGLDWDEELRSRLPWITIGASAGILTVLVILLA